MSALAAVGVGAGGLAVALHLVIFFLEAVVFSRPTVRRLFGVRTSDESAALRLFARNQGVYNLGLAVLVAVGIGLMLAGTRDVGAALIVAGCGVMALAALTLLVTAPRLWVAALAQGVPPLVAMGALLTG
jgi:putative membrane protein